MSCIDYCKDDLFLHSWIKEYMEIVERGKKYETMEDVIVIKRRRSWGSSREEGNLLGGQPIAIVVWQPSRKINLCYDWGRKSMENIYYSFGQLYVAGRKWRPA